MTKPSDTVVSLTVRGSADGVDFQIDVAATNYIWEKLWAEVSGFADKETLERLIEFSRIVPWHAQKSVVRVSQVGAPPLRGDLGVLKKIEVSERPANNLYRYTLTFALQKMMVA